ncbi:alanine:cation symporter family protein, partial [Akkermansiaceae bacterium]|nr:alanine:cation symporter family protein [Akkermansiaceae bacterium]
IAVGGGVIGVMIQGMKRATFSNEAGIGSAAIAHSAAKTKFAASEGVVALLEPFIDTVVVCTTTALVIIITGTYNNPDLQGVAITSAAFGSVISWFPIILTIAVILFAFSTMISWSYYGVQAWSHLFGRSKKAELIYKLIFCVFVVIGSSLSMGSVFDFSDAMIFAMSVPNIIAMYILMPKVKDEYVRYLEYTRSK